MTLSPLTPVGLVGVLFANLFLGGVTSLCLHLALFLHFIIRDRLNVDRHLLDLPLTIVGSIAMLLFPLWLMVKGYALIVPGVLGAFMLFPRRRITLVELALSSGTIGAILTLIVGARAVTIEAGQLLKAFGFQYGGLTRIVVGGVLLVAPVIAYRLYERESQRHNGLHSKKMQDAAYRKIEEEKWQLQKRIREINEWQEEMDRRWEAADASSTH